MNVYGRDRKGKGTKEGKTRRPQQGDYKIVFIPFACLSLAAGVTFHNHPILLPSNFITFYEIFESPCAHMWEKEKCVNLLRGGG